MARAATKPADRPAERPQPMESEACRPAAGQVAPRRGRQDDRWWDAEVGSSEDYEASAVLAFCPLLGRWPRAAHGCGACRQHAVAVWRLVCLTLPAAECSTRLQLRKLLHACVIPPQ